jgi:hypothetical protein
MTRPNKQRDVQIHMAREWGETLQSLADRHKLSVSRIESIVASERQLASNRAPYCARCQHSGDMHHNDDWEYWCGPCGYSDCDCPAMVPEHD